jgi:cell division septal protein FtsQ
MHEEEERKEGIGQARPDLTAFVCLAVGTISLVPFLLERYANRLPMKVRAFRIQGQRALSAMDLKNLAGIREGDPLFGGWIKKAPNKMIRNPRVEKVSIVRHVTGDVVINVSERRAKAIANFDELFYIDGTGRVLEKISPRAPEAMDLPVLTGPWSGLRPSPAFDREIRDGLGVLEAFAQGGLVERNVSELHLDPKLGWILYRVGSDARVIDLERKPGV